jgi:hypothetical protein
VQDYRSSSYKKIAKKSFSSKSSFGRFQSKTGKATRKVGSAAGDVVVFEGKKSDKSIQNLSYSSGGTKQSRIEPTKETKSVSDQTANSKDVEISPALASKINKQSLRQDRTYYARPTDAITRYEIVQSSKPQKELIDTYNPREQRVDKEKLGSEASFQAGLTKVSSEKARIAKNLSPIIGEYAATAKYFFLGSDEFDKGIPEGMSEKDVSAIRQTRLFNIGMIGGGALTTRPVVASPKSYRFTSKAAVKTSISDSLSVSKGRLPVGSSQVVVKSKGVFGQPKTTTYQVAGVFKETAKPTGQLGAASKQPILRTQGVGAYRITKVRKVLPNKKVADLRVSSVGGEVEGFGQKKVTSTLTKSGKSSADSYVQSYVGFEKGDTVVSGSVNTKGVSVSVGKKLLELSGERVGKPSFKITAIQKATGLEQVEIGSIRASPVVEINPGKVNLVTDRVYDVRFAGQKAIPKSARLTKTGVIKKLKSEQPKRTDVADYSFSPKGSTGSSVGSVQVQSLKQVSSLSLATDVKPVVVEAVKKIEGKPVIGKTPGGFGVSVSKSRNEVFSSSNSQSVVSGSKTKGFTVSSPRVSISNASVTRTSYGFAGVGSIGRISGFSKIKSLNVQKPSVSAISASSPISMPSSVSASKQSSVQDQVLVSQTLLSSAKPGFGISPTFFSSPVIPVVPVFPVFGKGGFGGFSVFVRRKGRFGLVGKASSLRGAESLGYRQVRGSAAASFKITDRSGVVVPISTGSGFYSKRGVVIQKPSFRIGSLGEKQEITFKGIASSKRKRRVGIL